MNLCDYMACKGRGRESHDLELQAMADPFLADALEGVSTVDGDHPGAVDRLQQRITTASTTRRPLSLRIVCRTAAVLLLGAAGLLLLLRPASPISCGKLLPPAATIPGSRQEQTEVPVPHSAAPAVAAQTPNTLPAQSVSSVRSDKSQRTRSAASSIDTVKVTGYNASPKAAFTGSVSQRKPLGETLGQQLGARPRPLPPVRSRPATPGPASRPLAPNQPADMSVTRLPPADPEAPELCDRFENDLSFSDLLSDDLPDELYGGGPRTQSV